MSDDKEISQARDELEAALQKWVRLSRRDSDELDVDQFFIQDYAIAVCSETMQEGYSNNTFMNFMGRPSMAPYQIIGLHEAASYFWKNQGYRD